MSTTETQTTVKTIKAKPKKVLPTDRAAVATQFEIIRGYAAASGPDRKPVSNEDVAKVVNIHYGTISNCNPFFLDVGFISKDKSGNVPADEVFSFASSSQWNAEKATQKLAPLIRKTWFSLSLLPKLAFRPLTLDQAVEFLADEAGAQPEYKDQLIALIDYMRIVGIISVEGNNVTLVKNVDERENTGGSNTVDLPNIAPNALGNANDKRTSGEEGNHHPFIIGLLQTLPEPETEWSMAGRVKWLQTASNVFGLMYTTKDGDDVEFIEITKKAL